MTMSKESLERVAAAFEELRESFKGLADMEGIMAFVPELVEVEGANIVMNQLGSLCGYLVAQGVPAAKVGAVVVAVCELFATVAAKAQEAPKPPLHLVPEPPNP
jgi:hypothetical protein